MARIITEVVYTGIVKYLSENETVALFQQLLLSPKTSEIDATAETECENQIEKGGDNE